MLVGAMLLSMPIAAAAQLAGDYVGTFKCHLDPWSRADLRIETSGTSESRVMARLSLTFPSNQDGNTKATVDMKGGYSKGTGDLGLEAKKWLGPAPKGWGWERLQIRANYEADRIDGDSGFGTCKFSFLRSGTVEAAKLVAELERRKEQQAATERREKLPPEWRDSETEVSDWEGSFEYVDASLTPAGWKDVEVEPVDAVHWNLHNAGMKCLVTTFVRWQGLQATLPAEHFDTKWHVVECRGNCKGVRYEITVPTGLVFHHGLTTPVPVLQVRSPLRDLKWVFTRPDARAPGPEVRIHTWSKSFGDSGPGCRLF